MAKAYEFIINLREAEIEGRFASIHFGGPETLYHSEVFTGTLADAIARRDALSAAERRCHQASIRMSSRRDRKPAGFDALPYPVHAAKVAP